MFSKIGFSGAAITALSLINPIKASALDAKRDICVPVGGGSGSGSGSAAAPVIVYVSTNVVSYPVFINTYISANTIININGGVTININNAPTFLSTVVTATATVTDFSTVTESATLTATTTTTAAGGAAATAAGFVIGGVTNAGAKRQASTEGYITFVGGNAQLVANKTAAAVFNIVGEELVTGGGIIGLQNSQLATGYGPFEVFAARPDVSTTWSASLGGPVTWVNGAFVPSAARFCVGENNFVFAEYTSETNFACNTITLIAEAPAPVSTTSSSTTFATTTSASSSSATSASTTTTADPSADLDVEPTATPVARRFTKKSAPQGNMRRGGVFRSPMKN
ncbi:hypothetical protein PVAG01_09357 [Phlyctema vagabunda]|uniref:DUF7908 domain-containing protein n=1 Tax=Phlyctema vagabunda TaxID=108571 RepID=A0ABR4P739_9HELO